MKRLNNGWYDNIQPLRLRNAIKKYDLDFINNIIPG